jgi:hypothetical protein
MVHCYACRLRQLPPVTGEWTADAHIVSTGCANKTMMGTYASPTVRRRYLAVCSLSMEVLRPLFTGVNAVPKL